MYHLTRPGRVPQAGGCGSQTPKLHTSNNVFGLGFKGRVYICRHRGARSRPKAESFRVRIVDSIEL